MPEPTPEIIANHLETLPLELYEPILANLSFRDVIALAQYAPEGSRLATALAISPKWSLIWPTYMAHKDEFQTLASLVVPVGGGRLFDPTDGALDVTPGQFHRRMARERQIHRDVHGTTDLDFFEYTIRQTSRRIQDMLGAVDFTTLTLLCQTISLNHLAAIAPWLKDPIVAARCCAETGDGDSEQAVERIRADFFYAMEGYCECPFLGWPRDFRESIRRSLKPCTRKHPGRKTNLWTVEQIKAFVDAYSAFQTRANAAKAGQLRALARLYARHHTRLREPLAPQDSERRNTRHIPEQLEVVARFVSRLVDLDRGGRLGRLARSRLGVSRFRYPHPCLVPYDWCLRLWVQVARVNPVLGGGFSPPGVSDDGSSVLLEESMKGLSISSSESPAATGSAEVPSPPEKLMRDIQTVNEGSRVYYKRAGQEAGEAEVSLPRTVLVDGNPARYSFCVHQEEALRVGARNVMLPPVNPREMEWLMAFLRVVEWMEEAYPGLAAEVKAASREAGSGQQSSA